MDDERIDLNKLRLAPTIRKFLNKNFAHFFIDGFILLNNGVTLGILYETESVTEYWYLWVFTPLICMAISYMEAYNLFQRGCNIPLRDFLHYMYISIFVIGFVAGFLFCINPINLIIFVSGLYLLVAIAELTYYKKYCKIFSLYTLKLTKKYIRLKTTKEAFINDRKSY